MRLVVAGLLLALCGSVGLADAGDYRAVEKSFKETWKAPKELKGINLKRLRPKKITAAEALEATSDPRAILAFAKATKQQLQFVELLEENFADRRKRWKQIEKPMRRALSKRKPEPDGTFKVSIAEKNWMNEEKRLEKLFGHILEERGVARRARTGMSNVLQKLTGKQREAGIKAFQSAIGKGDAPADRDFIRALGLVPGEDITAVLLAYAKHDSSPVAQTALHALGIQNVPSNVDLLLGFVNDERWQVRAAAIHGLSYFKNARVVEELIAAGKAARGVLQRHCFIALGRILGEPVPGGVDGWHKWWGENQARLVQKWAGQKPAPVLREPAPTMMRQGQGHTSFYGVQTNSKHIVFVLDRSGSMKEPAKGQEDKLRPKTRMEVAKEELKKAIRSLGADESDERGAASFNIVSFAHDVTVFKKGKMIEATLKAKEAAEKWIDKLEAVGGTNTYDALEAAFAIISARKEKKNAARGADTFFLLTDGEPTVGKVSHPGLIRKEVERMNRTRQVVIHTIEITSPMTEEQKEKEKQRMEKMTDDEKEEYEERKAAVAEFLERLAAENRGEHLAR